MLQRIMPLTIPPYFSARAWRKGSTTGVSCLALMCAVLLVPLASVQGQTKVNYNFEDGVMRGNPTRMQVPPRIMTENGNNFMRITGSASDKEGIPNRYHHRNRSTVEFTSHPQNMPIINNSNLRQTYSAKIRYRNIPHNSGVNFELFQSAPHSGGYGTPDSNGPVVIMWRGADGHVKFRANYANGTKRTTFDMGFIPIGAWHTYTVKAVWSHDPSKGRLEFYLDGKLKGTVRGRDVNLGPASNRLPSLKLGLYGDYAVGVLDVDNVKAGPSSGGSSGSSGSSLEGGGNMSCGSGCDRPSTRAAISAPTNIRVVSGQ